MKINDILKRIGAQEVSDDIDVQNIAIDSRYLDENTLWIAAKGIAHHALEFYRDDLKYAAIFYEPPYEAAPNNAIPIEDLRNKVSMIADTFYKSPSSKMTVIGVTGTDGKSSLVYFIAQALNAAMIGTIGKGKLSALKESSHTTPNALSVQHSLKEFADNNEKIVAMEVSSHALAQARVAAVQFDIAVFSNLSRDHLDYHKTIEAYFEAKAKLFSMDIKHAVINIDDEHGRKLVTENKVNPKAQLWLVSAENNNTFKKEGAHYIRAESYQLNAGGISLTACLDNEKITISTKLSARFNVDNLLNVIACLAAMGYQRDDIKEKVEALHGVPGRVEVIDLKKGKAIVDYAHTVGAVGSVLQGIRPHVKGKIWVIFGCGGNRDKGKRPLMAAAAEKYADHLIITDDNPRLEDPNSIIEDVLRGLTAKEKAHVIQPRSKAIAFGLAQLSEDDVLMILGKGHENYQIIGDTKHHFSDQEEVRKWLRH